MGRIIDVAIYRDVPEAERDAVVDDGGHMFLLRLWPFVEENDADVAPLTGVEETATMNMVEVMEGDAGVWIHPSDVADICFICHISDITGDKYGCLNGISDVYFVCYSSISGDPVLLSSFNQFTTMKKIILTRFVFSKQNFF